MYYFLTLLGRGLAMLPDSLLLALCKVIGFMIWVFPSSRMRLTKSNIRRCFPSLDSREQSKIALESASRMVEMALFVLASPYLSDSYLKSHIKLSSHTKEQLGDYEKNPFPLVLCVPHFSMMETITMFPLIYEGKTPPTGVIYRPFDAKGIEKWVKKSRERFGLKLISRKSGFKEAFDFLLKKNGCVAVLFDQEAGAAGTRGIFMNRVCSMSGLPGILAVRGKAKLAIFFARRTGFWSSEIDGEFVDFKSTEDVVVKINCWLEKKLQQDVIARYDWLWMHKRWKSNLWIDSLLRTDEKNEIFAEFLEYKSISKMPKEDVIWATLPDSFAKVMAILPSLKAMRKSRYDASVTLFCNEKHSAFLSRCGVAEKVIPLPNGNFERLNFFRKMRARIADIHIVFEDSDFARFCSFVGGAFTRIGISFDGVSKKRFVKWTYATIPSDVTEHISFEYEKFLNKFGMKKPADCSPFIAQFATAHKDFDSLKIALICGSDSSEYCGGDFWKSLLEVISKKYKNAKFEIYGNQADSRAAYKLLCDIEDIDIEDKTSLSGYANIAESLSKCDIAIACDCDITHIANAVGVAVVGLYGNTNPLREGLVFESKKTEVMPPDCPIQGGISTTKINVKDVEDAFERLLTSQK